MKLLIDFLRDVIDEFTDVIKEIIKPRTFFAFMFYACFVYLVIKEKAIPDSLNNIVSMILGFWFGNRTSDKNGEKNEKVNP